MMKRTRVIWLISIGLFLLISGILSPLALNNSANYDSYNFDKYVNVAQSLSGYLMPFIGLIGAVITFYAFYVQYEANHSIKEQFTKEQNNAHFYEMLKIHIDNVREFNIKSYNKNKILQKKKKKIEITKIIKPHGFNSNEEFIITENIVINETTGRKCFVLMLKDLHFTIEKAYEENEKLTNKLSSEILLQVSYRIFFWGTNSHHRYPKRKDQLKNEQVDSIDIINERLNDFRDKRRNKYKGQSLRSEYKIEGNKIVPINFRFIPMSGHSTRLAHYFRHLYQTAKHIYKTSNHQEKEFLQPDEIDFRFATLRAQMSNEEQLLLYYNYRIGFGAKWDNRYDSDVEGSDDYLFLSKYKMIHNIPLYDTIHHLVQHPEKHFEEYTYKHPTADLFEWS